MYKTIVQFKDLQDSGYLYRVGDTFPRTGFSVSAERINELATTKNRRHIALIEKVVEHVETVENTAETAINGAQQAETEKTDNLPTEQKKRGRKPKNSQ